MPGNFATFGVLSTQIRLDATKYNVVREGLDLAHILQGRHDEKPVGDSFAAVGDALRPLGDGGARRLLQDCTWRVSYKSITPYIMM